MEDVVLVIHLKNTKDIYLNTLQLRNKLKKKKNNGIGIELASSKY